VIDMVVATTSPRARSPFGHLLRRWRLVRALSQLELAGLAATTPRHISFLETGRSRPRHELVERLREVLGVTPPLDAEWFAAAGLASTQAPATQQRSAQALEELVAELCVPAFLATERLELRLVNAAAKAVLPESADATTLVDAFTSERARPRLANADEVAWGWYDRGIAHGDAIALIARLRGARRPEAAVPGVLRVAIRHELGVIELLALTMRPSVALPWTIEVLQPIDAAASRMLAAALAHSS
jgi:transcriptional regulator with XRE-family HTH domain